MKRNIPVSRPFIGEEEKKAVLEVLDSGMIVQGPRTAALEDAFAKVVGTKHAVATSSGTTALHLALLANGIGPGDEVITSPFTFIASVNSILFTGATPVFADIQEETFNIDPAAIEKVITKKTKAILPVHI
ncbi:MAG: DegT/DnrJ/EryC1/StrS aminotransferase family protein, partial [Polyangiaceae bacterium]|nr:DegT/DnrJ/EryC1/StrS aminotransferase family protein [Polyangiaceae bacterium]